MLRMIHTELHNAHAGSGPKSASEKMLRLAQSDPEWVNRVVLTVCRSIPFFPHNQTLSVSVGISQTCQSGVSNDVGLFAVEGRGRLRAAGSNTERGGRTGQPRLPERVWRAFRSMVLRRSRTRHEARCAISPLRAAQAFLSRSRGG